MSASLSFSARFRLTGHNASIYALAQGEEPHLIYSASGDGWIVQWNLLDPDLGTLVAEAPEQVFSLCYLPETNSLLAGTMNGQVNWIDLNDPSLTSRLEFHKKGVFDAQLINGSLYTLGGDGLITCWDIRNKRPIESIQLSGESLRSLTWSSSRNEFAVGASDGNIYLIDQTGFKLKEVIRDAHKFSAFSVIYTPDGESLISGGRDAMLRKWNLAENNQLEIEVPAHRYTINALAIDPDQQYLATGSRDKTLKIWDINNLKLLKVLEAGRDQGHVNSVNRLLWAKTGNLLLSASDDRTIIGWGGIPA